MMEKMGKNNMSMMELRDQRNLSPDEMHSPLSSK